MMLVIAVHSAKGGTGKTCIAQNLACAYAVEGKNVCLLDMDLTAPSSFNALFTMSKKWINDVLEGNAKISDVIVDTGDKLGTKGDFFVGYANPDISGIRDVSSKDRRWQARALRTLMDFKKELCCRGFDVVIMDTSPGVDYMSANVVVCSDYVIMVTKAGEYRGVNAIFEGIYRPLEKSYGVVENMNVNGTCKLALNGGIPLLATIPCMCEVSREGNKRLFSLEDPSHPFSGSILRIKNGIN
jgi:septum site-determining protein MinD